MEYTEGIAIGSDMRSIQLFRYCGIWTSGDGSLWNLRRLRITHNMSQELNPKLKRKITVVAALGLVITLLGFVAYDRGYYDSIPLSAVVGFMIIALVLLNWKKITSRVHDWR